ncbi:MAG: FliO/MopB family protein [Leptothrix sp. (in: b-proteobacteria)]
MSASWLSLLWFALILAAIPVALWLVKRSGAAGLVGRAQALPMRQVGSLGLGPQQRVVAIEVGHGAERRWLLLGVTPQQVNALHTFERWPGEALDAGAAPGSGPGQGAGSAPEPVSFAAELARRLRAGVGLPPASNVSGDARAR